MTASAVASVRQSEWQCGCLPSLRIGSGDNEILFPAWLHRQLAKAFGLRWVRAKTT